MDIFTNAKTVTPKRSRGSAHIEMKAAREVAFLHAAINDLKALHAEAVARLTLEARARFIAEGRRAKGKPANYKATADGAVVGLELRMRSPNSALTDDEVELLVEHDVSYGVEEPAARYVVNPDMDDGELAAISAVITGSKLPRHIKDNFIQRVEDSRRVVTGETVTAIFKLTDRAATEALLDVATVVATKPKLTTNDAGSVWRYVRSLTSQSLET